MDGQRPDGDGCKMVQDAPVRQLQHPGTGQSLDITSLERMESEWIEREWLDIGRWGVLPSEG